MRGEGRLRWAIFTNSVVSAEDNPDAHLWRELGRLLRQRDQEATFFEPRGNDAVRALLRRSGSRALSEFRGRHPDIEYRTLEPRHGAELVEWMTRTLATADVALIQANAADDLVDWLGKLTRQHLQTFFVDSGWNGTLPGSAGFAERISGYSALIVEEDRLAAYRHMTAGVPVRSFGTLPRPDEVAAQVEEPSELLEDACGRLIEIIVAVHEEERSSAGPPPIGPNGHH